MRIAPATTTIIDGFVLHWGYGLESERLSRRRAEHPGWHQDDELPSLGDPREDTVDRA